MELENYSTGLHTYEGRVVYLNNVYAYGPEKVEGTSIRCGEANMGILLTLHPGGIYSWEIFMANDRNPFVWTSMTYGSGATPIKAAEGIQTWFANNGYPLKVVFAGLVEGSDARI